MEAAQEGVSSEVTHQKHYIQNEKKNGQTNKPREITAITKLWFSSYFKITEEIVLTKLRKGHC